MRFLIDTNVLTRSIRRNDPQHTVATNAIKHLLRSEYQLFIVPQVIYEFWVVCTRPVSANGLSLSIQQVKRRVLQLAKVCQFLPDPPDLYDQWLHCVTTYRVSGKNAHDARLIATMQLHAIPHLVTLNGGDFRRYQDVEVHSPLDVLAGKL